MDFNFQVPTRVRTERGLAKKIGEFFQLLGYQKVFLVTDKGVRNAGILQAIESSLHESSILFEVYDEVIANPSCANVMVGVKKLKDFDPDSVLAVGGGSSIDAAKGIAVMAKNSGEIIDYEGVGKIPHEGLPLIAVPTTSGTGSEVTSSTIVTTNSHFKAAIISPFLYPKYAILDAEITVGLPMEITAATGMDALTHAIESYTSKTSNPASAALAIYAIGMIKDNIEKAYFVGTDIESRENMLVASMLAGAAFSQSRLGNVHAISHTFSGVFNVPHGIANATLLPFVMKFNLPACPEKMADIAKALGEKTDGMPVKEAAELAIQAIIKLNDALNIPSNIKDLNVSLDELPKLVEDSMRSGNVLINPRLTSSKDIEEIIENAYNGIL
ncbi:iron-containing alcohol dehydrogenase [Fictibacillus fluitans]|uniref:Iron-containing alcohol dehydrogenase n=1 Tax=Fictibacillus fluitans TaxID=3058422 RepID=A0ABT8HYQ4_9BACL|nr:iron-containing alcohol dehydrogenase [Fictibacillus sp. NE201]MDN4525918.1 iron-containing alcohol dehydrogenase [Fictibacillus sp. NE201]